MKGFNCEGGINYLTYSQATKLMSRVDDWTEADEGWAREGYSGNVKGPLRSFKVSLKLDESYSGRLTISSGGRTLGVYRTNQLYKQFWDIRKPIEKKEKRLHEKEITDILDEINTITRKR